MKKTLILAVPVDQNEPKKCKVKVPAFHGSSLWNIIRFNLRLSRFNCWTAVEQEANLVLREQVAGLLRSLSARSIDITNLMAALEQHYGDDYFQNVCRCQLKTMTTKQ